MNEIGAKAPKPQTDFDQIEKELSKIIGIATQIREKAFAIKPMPSCEAVNKEVEPSSASGKLFSGLSSIRSILIEACDSLDAFI